MMDTVAVARAFNERAPSNWKARPYSASHRQSGVVNGVSFAYKGGMVSFVMDCDKPVGAGFQVKFTGHIGVFGDFLASIQRGLAHIMTRLDAAGFPMAVEVPADLSPNRIQVAMRKDGAVIHIAVHGVEEPQKSSLSSDLAEDLC